MMTLGRILSLAWHLDGGKWRRYYFLHPWRLYYVIRDQWPDKTPWHRIKIDDAAIWKAATK